MNYKEKQLKNLKEANEHLNLALGKFMNVNYIGDIREFKNLVGVKLKLEQIIKRSEAGYRWEKGRYERSRSSTRSTK